MNCIMYPHVPKRAQDWIFEIFNLEIWSKANGGKQMMRHQQQGSQKFVLSLTEKSQPAPNVMCTQALVISVVECKRAQFCQKFPTLTHNKAGLLVHSDWKRRFSSVMGRPGSPGLHLPGKCAQARTILPKFPTLTRNQAGS